jgi:spore germination cell wall hydrolase CwlJ-like protein
MKGVHMKVATSVAGLLAGVAVFVAFPEADVNADTSYIQIEQPAFMLEREYPQDDAGVLVDFQDEEMLCLAKNIYYEANGQPVVGKYAVTHVVLNRVESMSYPDTICGVIQQAELSQWHLDNTGKEVPIRNRCQFSWYCDGLSDDPIPGRNWEEAVRIASEMYSLYLDDNLPLDITEDSMYYHATYVNPYWAKHMTRVAQIGDHIFYRN